MGEVKLLFADIPNTVMLVFPLAGIAFSILGILLAVATAKRVKAISLAYMRVLSYLPNDVGLIRLSEMNKKEIVEIDLENQIEHDDKKLTCWDVS